LPVTSAIDDERPEMAAERRLQALMAITAALARGSDAGEILQSVVESARYLLDAESARLEMVVPLPRGGASPGGADLGDGRGRKLVAASGLSRNPVGSVRSVNEGVGSHVVHTGTPVIALQLSAGLTAPAEAARRASPYLHNESGVAVPLRSAPDTRPGATVTGGTGTGGTGTEVIGTLAVFHTLPFRFGPADVEVLEQFAVLANLAIDAGERLQRAQDDLARRQLGERRLHHLARTDTLTGLANRRAIIESVEAALGRQDPAGSVALLFIDLDRFKRVNDGLGHRAGDALLIEVGKRFAAALHDGEVLGRLGGDEFVVLLEAVPDPEVALKSARRLAASLAEPIVVDGRHLAVTASIGVALAEAEGNVGTLLRDADAAMYQAKAAGRDTERVLDRRAAASVLADLDLEEELRRAVAGDQLRLVLQPVFDLASGRLVAFEALLRWNHPDRGLLLPADFLAVAEETGLIRSVGGWVLQRAVDALAFYLPARPDLMVGVNISARQLASDELVDGIDEALDRSGVPAGQLLLEITESLAMRPSVDRNLQRIRDRGVRLAIDDLGTGYSNLAHLKTLPVSVLKIDHSFVSGVGNDRRDDAIVSTLLGLGESLGMRVVAEGIETPVQLRTLRELGCRYGQGNLLAPAGPPPSRDALGELFLPATRPERA
jgi:diguanylate cyclase (GGDEF)-like protein